MAVNHHVLLTALKLNPVLPQLCCLCRRSTRESWLRVGLFFKQKYSVSSQQHISFKKHETTTTATTTTTDDVVSTNQPTTTLLRSFGPSVRLLLTLYDIRPELVTATGPHRRLLKGDVLDYITKHKLEPKPSHAFAAQSASVAAKTALAPLPPTPVPTARTTAPNTGNSFGETDYLDVQLNSMHKSNADQVSQSKLHVPHCYISTDCLTGELNQVRDSLAEEGVDVNDVIIKACATALQRIPAMNCLWSEGEIRPHPTVDIAVAEATPTAQVTPVVHKANTMSISDISAALKELAVKAKDGTLLPSESKGGPFIVYNLGTYGVKEFTAILNHAQCAILAVGCEQASLRAGSPVTTMNITLTFDARVVDEAVAAQFLAVVKHLLENPLQMGV